MLRICVGKFLEIYAFFPVLAGARGLAPEDPDPDPGGVDPGRGQAPAGVGVKNISRGLNPDRVDVKNISRGHTPAGVGVNKFMQGSHPERRRSQKSFGWVWPRPGPKFTTEHMEIRIRYQFLTKEKIFYWPICTVKTV